MVILIFAIGVLLGIVAGAAACVRYLRQELAANVAPRLEYIRLRLENLEAEINFALNDRYNQPPPGPPR